MPSVSRLTPRTLGGLALVPILSLTASAMPFTEGVVDDGDATDALGQSFVVGLEPSPDPGLSAGDPVVLGSVRFSSGGGGTGATETRLAILPAAFFDFNGDPNGSFTPTVSDAVGVSTNAFDTTGLAFGDEMRFEFGDGLNVAFGDVLSAVFVTVDSNDVLTPIDVSTAFIRFEETSPGVFEPVANYGGADNFDATALFGPLSADGFAGGATSAFDLSFEAAFVPEPGVFLFLMRGLGLAAASRSRRPVEA